MVNGIRVSAVDAFEILDSRSRPTLHVTVRAEDERTASAGVPAGASTGKREAVELRDGGPARYHGQGLLQAVRSVTGEIADLVSGRTWGYQAEVDMDLVELDATPTRGRLGANAIVGVSIAMARLFAGDTPLWRHLTGPDVPPRLRCRISTCSTAVRTRPTTTTSATAMTSSVSGLGNSSAIDSPSCVMACTTSG